MSFFKKLFGGGGAPVADDPAAAPVAASAEYNGFTIEARPYRQAGQYQLAGVIAKEVGGLRREHRFVRADRFSGADEAAKYTLVKARQIIDQMGEKIFNQ